MHLYSFQRAITVAPEIVKPLMKQTKNKSSLLTVTVTVACIGVVYGDIGTSPLYTLRECLTGEAGIAVTKSALFGFLSLIFWLLMLVVSVKYISFVMRADNDGEGGIITLMALAIRNLNPRWIPFIMFIGLVGGVFSTATA